MLLLYYAPGASSLSAHIALREAEVRFDLTEVNLRTQQLVDGRDYGAINPKRHVPCLELEDGECLTENPAILQYIADLVPAKGLAPPQGTLGRYRQQEWLSFICSELHKGFAPLLSERSSEEYREEARSKLASRFGFVDRSFAGKSFLTDGGFTVADGYLFTIARWSGRIGLDLGGLSELTSFLERVAERPAVRAALRTEGLR